MFKIDQFTAANEAAINQFTTLAELSLANAERLAQIGLGAARDAVEQATAHAQSLAGAKDVTEVLALNSAAVEPAIKRAYSYSRTVYETAAETNAEVKKLLEKQAAEFNRAAVAAFEEAFKYAPAGSESVVENVKAAFATAQKAYDNVAAMNKQIYDTVGRTVDETAGATRAASRKAGARRRRG